MTHKILFVDDEANLLSAMERQFRKQYEVDIALGAEKGLEAVSHNGSYAVIVSDFRMPGLNGVEFLAKVRELAPDSTRMMLTGHADLKTAMEAVNEGHIFRFLTKPCPPEVMGKALESGVSQYRLINAERELLEKTLNGSIKVLTQILSLLNPEAFGRASRISRYVREVALALSPPGMAGGNRGHAFANRLHHAAAGYFGQALQGATAQRRGGKATRDSPPHRRRFAQTHSQAGRGLRNYRLPGKAL